MRPLFLALATLSHSVAASAMTGLALWLASYAPLVRPLALPAFALGVIMAFAGAIGAACLCRASFAEFARLMAAPIDMESR